MFRSRRSLVRLAGALCAVAIGLVAVAQSGCASPPADDSVKADRSTYEAIAPVTRKLVSGELTAGQLDADQRQSINDTLDTWDLRIRGDDARASAATTQPTAAETAAAPGRPAG